MLVRIRKSQLDVPKVIAEDKYYYCLDCWKLFMSRDKNELNAKVMNLPDAPPEQKCKDGKEKEAYASDSLDKQYQQDMEIGAGTSTSIHSLLPMYRWAFYKLCGIGSVWNYPNTNWTDAIVDAEKDLREKLKNNIVTEHLFM